MQIHDSIRMRFYLTRQLLFKIREHSPTMLFVAVVFSSIFLMASIFNVAWPCSGHLTQLSKDSFDVASAFAVFFQGFPYIIISTLAMFSFQSYYVGQEAIDKLKLFYASGVPVTTGEVLTRL
jgi:hypothetical protein